MEDLKLQVKRSFRTEMFAAGLYAVLAEQYGNKNPDLYNKLKEASEQEHMHGRMFSQFMRSRWGEDAGSEKIWIAAGSFAARMMRPVSLEKKLKSLSGKESEAVKRIEQRLKSDDDPSLLKVLKRILPDEKSHAAIYGKIFT
jgi:rubrerythrin